MRVLWIAAGAVLVDQISKIVVVNTMSGSPYQSIQLLGDWLKLTYTENPGMAFGITFGPPGLITAFSIIATLLIIVYMFRVRKGYTPYRASLGLILGGAIGNIIDRVFYGVIMGYGGLFEGRVVDFIHVNVWSGYVSDAVPLFGGKFMALFPIWNVADMAIVIGVVGILVFQKRFHQRMIEASEAASIDGAKATASSPFSAASGLQPPLDVETPDLSVNGLPPAPGRIASSDTSSLWAPPPADDDPAEQT
ncbi:MAG: signal peptidase II [Rhodothermales bacterium]